MTNTTSHDVMVAQTEKAGELLDYFQGSRAGIEAAKQQMNADALAIRNYHRGTTAPANPTPGLEWDEELGSGVLRRKKYTAAGVWETVYHLDEVTGEVEFAAPIAQLGLDPSDPRIGRSNKIIDYLGGVYTPKRINIEFPQLASGGPNRMFDFMVRGYAYASSRPIDIHYCGFAYNVTPTFIYNAGVADLAGNMGGNVGLEYSAANGLVNAWFEVPNAGTLGFEVMSRRHSNVQGINIDQATITLTDAGVAL